MVDPTAPQTPIQVSPHALPDTLAALFRYVIATVGAYLVGAGYVDAENIDGIATLLFTIATVAYGLYQTHRKKRELVVAAEAAPDRVAQVR